MIHYKVLGYFGWLAEIQALSYYNYRESKEGRGDHTNREGKKRILPPMPYLGNISKEDFTNMVQNNVPKNFVYQSGRSSGTGGNVYFCTPIENFCYFYIENLKTHPEYFREIVHNKSLFPDKERE